MLSSSISQSFYAAVIEETPSVKYNFGDSFLQARLGNHFTDLLCYFLEIKYQNSELRSYENHSIFIQSTVQSATVIHNITMIQYQCDNMEHKCNCVIKKQTHNFKQLGISVRIEVHLRDIMVCCSPLPSNFQVPIMSLGRSHCCLTANMVYFKTKCTLRTLNLIRSIESSIIIW
jgi:hypothetical protein